MLTIEIEFGGVKRRVPTPIVEIEWAEEDRLPFPFCLSVLGPPPACQHIHHVTVARGNAVLVDHGRTDRAARVPGTGAGGNHAGALRR